MSLFGNTTQGNLFSSASIIPKTTDLSLTEKKSDNESYIASFKTDLGEYEINLSLKHDKLIITCNSDVEFLSIYSYSKEINLDDFKKLSNSFKFCENIGQCFTAFKNVLKGITLKINNNDYISKFEVKFSDDDSLTIILTIPLINGEYENIEINFDKKKKIEIFEQFKILRSKYLKMKDLASSQLKNNLFGIQEIEEIEKGKTKGIFGNWEELDKFA